MGKDFGERAERERLFHLEHFSRRFHCGSEACARGRQPRPTFVAVKTGPQEHRTFAE